MCVLKMRKISKSERQENFFLQVDKLRTFRAEGNKIPWKEEKT